MFVRLKKYDWTNITILQKFLSMRVKKELSAIWTAEFSIPISEPEIKEECIAILNICEIWIKNKLFFVGCVSKVKVDKNYITYNVIDWVWLSQYRYLRTDQSWSLQLSQSLTNAYNAINAFYSLPFSLWLNNVSTVQLINHNQWTTLFDILDWLRSIKGEYRSVWYSIDYSEQTGIQTWWLLRYVYNWSSNIVERSWEISIDDFYNSTMSRNTNNITEYVTTDDVVSQADNPVIDNFIFSPDGHTTKTLGSMVKMPTIEIDANQIDRLNTEVWDIYKIYLWTPIPFLSLEAESKVQSIEVIVNGWRIEPTIKVSTEKQKDKTIGSFLQKINNILNNLSKNVA